MACTVSRPWMEMSLARQNSMAAIFLVGEKEGQTQERRSGSIFGEGAGSHGAQDDLELHLSTAFIS